MTPLLSAVINSRNEGVWLKRTVESLRDTLPHPSEIIVVDDGSDDRSAAFLSGKRSSARLVRAEGVGVARARNLGAGSARAATLVFCDAHMKFDAGWWRPMTELIENPRVAGVAPLVASTRRPDFFGYGMTLPKPDLEADWLRPKPRRPFPAPVLPGCCFMIRRDRFFDAGGYDERLRSRGGVDGETAIRFWLLGHEFWITPESRVWHSFRERAPYPDRLVDVVYNRLRLAFIHLKPSRLAKVVQELAWDRIGAEALLLIAQSGVAERRNEIFSKRIRDDDWFFERFQLGW